MPNEIYQRAPVQFVSLRVRFPLSPRLQAPGGKEQVYEHLAERFPILDAIEGGFRLQLPPGIGAPMGGQPAGGPQQLRMTNRERSRSFTLGPRMLLFECTDHESFDVLRDVVSPALQALLDVASPAGLNDVTLKYVDEIRHPAVASLRDWQGLIDERLIGPSELLDTQPQQTGGVAVYQLSEEHQVRVTYGAAPEGFVVDPNGPLRVQKHEDGPLFQLDIESEWTSPAESVPLFSVQDVLTIADRLHNPVHDVFENAITPQLRDYFRGTGDDGSQ
ncbi:MAG: TIGR04255 family protein [Solirubrobacteraceae bacterium]